MRFTPSLLIVALSLAVSLPPAYGDIETDYGPQLQQFEVEPTIENLEILLDHIVDDYPAAALSIYADAGALLNTAPAAKRIGVDELACWANYRDGNIVAAKQLCQSLSASALSIGDRDREAAAYNTLALIRVKENDDTAALKLFDRAIAVANDTGMRAAAYTNAGFVLKDSGAYEMAFDRFFQALEESRDPTLGEELSCYHAAPAYSQLGAINHRLGALEAAVSYYQLALDCGEVSEHTWDRVSSLHHLTEVYLDLGQIDLAEQRSLEAIQIAKGRSTDAQSVALSSRAAVLLQQGRHDEALAAAHSALDGADYDASSHSRTTATLILAKTLAASGQNAAAIDVIEALERDVRPLARFDVLERLMAVKPAIIAASGDYAAAYAGSQDYVQLSRANLKESALERVALLQSQLDADRQAAKAEESRLLREAAEARADKAAWVRNVSIAGGLMLLLVGYLAIGRIYQARQAAHMRAVKTELEDELLVRTDALKSEAEARVELETRLLQAQKLEAVGQLTGGIAHDFNNLLTIVLGATELALRNSSSRLDDSDRDLLRGAYDAANAGADITRQLLAFARKQPLDPKPTRIGEHIGSTIEMFDRALGDRVRLTTTMPEDDVWCEIDRGQLSAALLNLMLNARDALNEHGEIRMKCQVDKVRNTDGPVDPGHYFRIDIEDSGSGMDEYTLGRAVDPFFTTKETGRGNGLGLSMVYGFANQSHGGFSLASSVGEGTTATIWLPTCAAPADSCEIDSITTSGVDSAMTSTILVIEDQATVRNVAVKALRQRGFQVTEANSGDAARDLLIQGYRPDLVFCDVSMPGEWDGLQLARWLKEYAPDIAVLLTSGYFYRAPDNSDFAFLSKPYDPNELNSTIDQLLVASVTDVRHLASTGSH